MDTNKPLSLFLVAILVASVFTVVGIASLPVQRASAQAVTIETSADDHDSTFFTGLLQVIIEDENTDDDGDSIQVDVTVELDGGGEDTQTLTIDDTSDGSQRFEFFLVHNDAVDIDPDDPDAAVEDVYQFGDGAADFNVAGFELFDSGQIEIEYEGESVIIQYDETPASLSVDRDVPYGTDSIVYLTIYDPDGNLDPTARGSYVVANVDLGNLTDITGGFISGDLILNETSDNSAMFEAELQLNATDNTLDNELVFEDDVVAIEVTDMVNYDDVNAAENTSTDTSEVTIEVEDSDGEVDDIGAVTFASGIKVTVRDDDQNRDSQTEDTIEDALIVVVDATNGDEAHLDLEETGDNTGVFEIDLSNNELQLRFLADDDDIADFDLSNSTLWLRPADIEEDIIISYLDPLDDNSDESTVAEFTVAIDLTPGQIAAPEEVGVTDEFTATLTDNDLNINSRVRDSWSFIFDGTGPFNLTRGGEQYGLIYTLDLELNGEQLDFNTAISTTMTETGVNTGIFEFDIDLDDVAQSTGIDLDDGDDLELLIEDFMADTADPDEDDVRVTIGKPNVGLDFSRTTVPLPPEDPSGVFDFVGETVVVTMIVVDPILNNSTNVEQTFPFILGDGDHEFLIEVDNADGLNDCALEDGDALGACDLGDVNLDDVLTIGNLEETGKNTGVFEVELEFIADATESGDWQNAEFTFTYFDSAGDEESAGFTFRGSDGIVSVDQPSAKSGTIITVTVEDQDLNLDDNEVDDFESSLDAAGNFVLAVQSEDDDIGGGATQTFEETGEDTGVFTAEFEVGEDVLIVDLAQGDQATNILVTYNDEVDSTGGGGDELEVNVPVVSGTGSIQVTPELVGPATTLTILIVDSDLDADASSVDEYTEAELDGMVEFSSSRNEVNEDGPDIEETGPNTGVFMFTLELITDADLCADDDLDDGSDRFDATGGDTDSTIGACPGDLINIRYEDERTGSGGGSTVSEVVEVNSWDPEFVADKDSYSIGDRVTVTISDPDANRDPDIADSLTDIRVTSDSDRVGEEFSAIETGRDTGVFRLTFGTTSGTAGGSISVKQGDDITIRYTDEFPADFIDEEEDKDFEFVISVGGASGVGTTAVTAPELQDVTGQEIDEVSAGQQVVLATSVRNNNDAPQPFVALIEVRDDTGVTVFLAWQTGTLPASGQTQVGLSWTPDTSGDYEIRTFVISDLNNPQVLSPVSESNITVN